MKTDPAVDIIQAFREGREDFDQLKALIGPEIDRITALYQELNKLEATVLAKIREHAEKNDPR